MHKYEELEFENVLDEQNSDTDTEDIKKLNEDKQDLLTKIKDSIGVSDVKFSDKLKNHPVSLHQTTQPCIPIYFLSSHA